MRTVEELFEMGEHWIGTVDKETRVCINDCFKVSVYCDLGMPDVFTIITTPHDTINLGILSFVETYLK